MGATDERTVRDAFRRLTAGTRDRVQADPASRRAAHCWLLDMDGVLAREEHAIRLVLGGARFIATNPDPTGPSASGPLPATGSIAALISRATRVEPYFVGKPNPLMMRSALNALGAHSETTTIIGDRMDTDVVAGLEAGLETILVLSGVTARGEAERFPYRASRIVDSVADLVDELGP